MEGSIPSEVVSDFEGSMVRGNREGVRVRCEVEDGRTEGSDGVEVIVEEDNRQTSECFARPNIP